MANRDIFLPVHVYMHITLSDNEDSYSNRANLPRHPVAEASLWPFSFTIILFSYFLLAAINRSVLGMAHS
jgi:hypothetical protein